jgi:sulfate permease, SulP family
VPCGAGPAPAVSSATAVSRLQGAAKMGELVTLVRDAGVSLHLTRVKPAVGAVLKRDGVIEAVGEDKIHGNIPGHRGEARDSEAEP